MSGEHQKRRWIAGCISRALAKKQLCWHRTPFLKVERGMYFQHQCKVAPRQRIACVLISWGNFIITHKLKLRCSVTGKKSLRLTQSFTTSSAACISIIMTRIDIAMPNSTMPQVPRSTLPTELMFWKGIHRVSKCRHPHLGLYFFLLFPALPLSELLFF